jgi:hydroxymethylpyrimidine pyrophosphatase-like HAD family hydrolase
MLVSLIENDAARDGADIAAGPLPDEVDFYERHAWCVQLHLTLAEAHRRLADELEFANGTPVGWQRSEAAVNIWLIGSAILNAADERLRGSVLKFPAPLARRAPIRQLKSATSRLTRDDKLLRAWRNAWSDALHEFVPVLLWKAPSIERMTAATAPLRHRVKAPLPKGLGGERLGIPSPFQRLDLTHHDVVALADRLIERDPDRTVRFALVGLRTSGTYFLPLIRARLEAAGYRDVAVATLEPKKGAGRLEMRALRDFAADGRIGVLIDDPPDTGGAVLAAVATARAAGFARERLRVLVPTHPASPHWAAALPQGLVVTLAPDNWHKVRLLRQEQAENAIRNYFPAARVIASDRAAHITDGLHSNSPDPRMHRLKRVYEVEITQSDGSSHRAFVIAKSVGCGWFGYSAFLAAYRLAGRVPPLLGLRDGILHSVFIPTEPTAATPDPETVAAYVAGRVRSLSLAAETAGVDLKRHNNGIRLLEKALSRAYGGALVGTLMRARVGARLRGLPCPVPTWIDGNMRSEEWVAAPDGWLKTDFEHHGLGKGGLNVVDPALDLAAAMLEFDFTKEDERDLISAYVDQSGDTGVPERLFVNKLMAAVWCMNSAQEVIFGTSADADELQKANRRFIAAWHSLTIETARCAGRVYGPEIPTEWRGPLVFLDVDGVIDRRVFGFPATSAAGIRALAALTRHPCSVVLNTARSVDEVKAYCEAYGLAGGVAEYGAYIWDAIRGQGRALVDSETAEQLDRLRQALSSIPGVFLDDRHRYSIRAFTYRARPDGALSGLLHSVRAADVGDGAVSALSPILVKQVMQDLGLDRLRVHPTTIDTTMIGRDLDKGTGLAALRDWVMHPACETIAVGDSEADLAMFRVATRSFAPGNIGCASIARLIGCEIVPQRFQNGLLEIAHRLGALDKRGSVPSGALSGADQLMQDVFAAADTPWTRHMLRGLCDPKSIRTFIR